MKLTGQLRRQHKGKLKLTRAKAMKVYLKHWKKTGDQLEEAQCEVCGKWLKMKELLARTVVDEPLILCRDCEAEVPPRLIRLR